MSDDDLLKHRVMRLEALVDEMQCQGCKSLQKKLEQGQQHYSEVVLQLSTENRKLRERLRKDGAPNGGNGFMRYSSVEVDEKTYGEGK